LTGCLKESLLNTYLIKMNRTILVNETDNDILEIVTLILANQGFVVKPLMAEEAALTIIAEVKPCAILLDVIRVTEEGTRLCRQIRRNKGTMHIPIVVLSTQPKATALKDIYADEVLLKPFDVNNLIAVVENASRKLVDTNAIAEGRKGTLSNMVC
jgi:DNA-binding response OmpR family regulator